MPLDKYLTILLRRGWIMILLGGIAAAVAFAIISQRIEENPQYRSTVEVLVIAATPDYGQGQVARLLLEDYASWMRSTLRAEQVIADLGLEATPEALLGSVTIVADDERTIITVEARGSDPDQTAAVAARWAELLVEWREAENESIYRVDQINAEVLDRPRTGLNVPNPLSYAAAAGVAGGLLGFGLILLLEFIGSRFIRTPEDVDLPMLGVIPSEGG